MSAKDLPFRFPTQDAGDLELVEESPFRVGMPLEAAYGAPHPKVPEHRLVWQEPVTGRDGALFMRRVYRRLPGTLLMGQAMKASWGAVAQTSVQDVPTGTAADSGFTVLESTVEPRDAQSARKRTVSVPEWPVLVSREVEYETRTPVTVTRRMVAADAPLPEFDPLVIERRLTAVNPWRSVETVRRLEAVPEGYTEHKPRSVRFPARSGVHERAAFTLTVMARVEVSFSLECEEPELLPLIAGSNYESKIGTWATVSATCTRWKGSGLWRTELWKVKLV